MSDTTDVRVQFQVPGPAVGKRRARVTRTGAYTPQKTKSYEAQVKWWWRTTGAVYLGEGPIAAYVSVLVSRPKTHMTTKGVLSAEGRRNPHPTRTPDLDNICKSILDALNRLAYRDDSQIIELWASRRWCSAGADRTEVTVWRWKDELDDRPKEAA